MRWTYRFWRGRYERGDDIVKIYSEGRAGWIAYRRGASLFLLGFERYGGSLDVSTQCVRQLAPTGSVLSSNDATLLIHELQEIVRGIEIC